MFKAYANLNEEDNISYEGIVPYIDSQVVHKSNNKKKNVDPIDFILSDSSDEKIYKNVKRVKKVKKLTKSKIIKKYKRKLPTVADSSSPFRKYIFLKDAPKDERDKFFFIDDLGNVQLIRYGCIYEKHIPKYRSKVELSFDEIRKKYRYFENLKGMKFPQDDVVTKQFACSTNCVCNQDFIPIPFDKEDKSDNKIINEENKDVTDEIVLTKITELNEIVTKEPQNAEAWLSLVQLQDDAVYIGFKKKSNDKVVLEKKLAILEKALLSCSNNIDIQVTRMKCGQSLWDVEKTEKEWDHLLFIHGTTISIWKAYIQYVKMQRPRFSVEKVILAYGKCFQNFYNIMSGRNKFRIIQQQDVYGLCELLSDCTSFLAHSGNVERATAIWQANIEFNFLCPPNVIPQDCGLLTEDPLWKGFSHFWESNRPRIGEPNCRGWGNEQSNESSKVVDDLRLTLRQFSEETENSVLRNPYKIGQNELWLHLEQTRSLIQWLPGNILYNSDEEDDSTGCMVPFSAVRPFLITLHAPRNIASSSTFNVNHIRNEMLILFFNYFGVYLHPLMQQTCYSIVVKPVPEYLDIKRHGLPRFIHVLFDRLQNASDALPYLELSYHFQMSLHADSWKTAFTSIKQAAKRLFSVNSHNNQRLWLLYSLLEIDLLSHPLFSSAKSRTAVNHEIRKVLTGLLSQTDQLNIDDRLLLSSTYIRLVTLNRNFSSDDNNYSNNVELQQDCRDVLLDSCNALSQCPPMMIRPNMKNCSSLTTCTDFSEYLTDVFDYILNTENSCIPDYWFLVLSLISFCNVSTQSIQKFQNWFESYLIPVLYSMGSSLNWTISFLQKTCLLLEYIVQLVKWATSNQIFNQYHICRLLLAGLLEKLSETQNKLKIPIIDTILSSEILQGCINVSKSDGGQLIQQRNFFWKLISYSGLNDLDCIGYQGHWECIVFAEMEFTRYQTILSVTATAAAAAAANSTNLIGGAAVEGRADRVRSTLNRILDLPGVDWRVRLYVWLKYLRFEHEYIGCIATGAGGGDGGSGTATRTKNIFYRAVTDLPGCKSLYLAAVSLLPESMSEIVQLMKEAKVRLSTNLEEVALIERMRAERTADIDADNDNDNDVDKE